MIILKDKTSMWLRVSQSSMKNNIVCEDSSKFNTSNYEKLYLLKGKKDSILKLLITRQYSQIVILKLLIACYLL